MKLIDRLSEMSLNLKILKELFDNPKKWYRISDLRRGVMYNRYKEIFGGLSSMGILKKKKYIWIAGRNKAKREGFVYNLNLKNKFVKILNEENIKADE